MQTGQGAVHVNVYLAKVQYCEAQVDRGGQGSLHGHKFTLLLVDLSLPLCQAWLLTSCLHRPKCVVLGPLWFDAAGYT